MLTPEEKAHIRERAERWVKLADDLDRDESSTGTQFGADQLRTEARRDFELLDEIEALRNQAVGTLKSMSLRDYFAGQALAGYVAHDPTLFCEDDECAKRCYERADAMLRAREAKP